MLRAIDGLAAVSLIGWWPVRGIVLAATVVTVVLMLRYARRVTSILLATVLLAGLVLADLLLARYAYVQATPDADELPYPPTSMKMIVEIPGNRSGFAARPARVYLPPAAAANPGMPLPVLMLLHGVAGAPEEWLDQGSAARIADWWAGKNGGVAPVLVMPDVAGVAGTGGCAGAGERYLTEDVPEVVRERFHTQPPGSGWAVVGHGAGGVCALTLTLLHPELFPTFADFGGAGTSPDPARDPATLLRQAKGQGLGAWFEVGATDPAAAGISGLARAAQEVGLDTCLVLRPGEAGGYPTSARAFVDALPWLAARVGQAPQTPELRQACAKTIP